MTFTYLLVGAAIFDALEGPNNEKVKEGLVQLRENLKEKYGISENDYKMIEVLIEERKPHKTGPQWKFAGSLYYAFVTLALIGLHSAFYFYNFPPEFSRIWSFNSINICWENVHSGIFQYWNTFGPHHVSGYT